jgi:hypothetical protein
MMGIAIEDLGEAETCCVGLEVECAIAERP